MLRRTVPAVLLILTTLACAGDAGPAGPQGPAGPPGPAGPAGALDRADFTGTIGTSGVVSAPLPTASVANGKVPVIACYVAQSTGTAWLPVAQTPTDADWPACGLTGISTTTPAATLINVPAGYRYYIIAVW